MQNPVRNLAKAGGPTQPVSVWDLPTRLFHWLLAALVAASFVTGKIGGNAMAYHERSGLAILVLLLFRVAWGFVGSRSSRFADFLKGPRTVLRYARGLLRPDAPRHLGHNPLGGWSVVAMLAALFIQAGTGLFANDDILTEGPLFSWVSKATSDALTRVHLFNRQAIVLLVALHLGAILFHWVVKGDNLVKPMITGVKNWEGGAAAPADGRTWAAALIAGLAAEAVYLLVR
ncbi:MAG: cytochrome b/b6 domain-containing protein [Desulfobacterales bacterium]|nr:cytochrome b/b6 domain-containing protein [Desulfobacterales bacterium]